MSTMHIIENAINPPQLFLRVSNIELVEQIINTFHYSHRLSFQSKLAKDGVGIIIQVNGSEDIIPAKGMQISNFH